MEKDEDSLEHEDRSTTRVHFAGCADRAGKVIAALRMLQPVLEDAIKKNNGEIAELVRRRVAQLLKRLGAVTITEPPGLDLEVTIDEAPATAAQLEKPIALDPGKHRVHAEGLLEGSKATFDEVITLAEGERTTVAIALKPSASEFLTPGQLVCMQLAKTQEDVFLCLPGKGRPLVVTVALEMSAYMDTFAVRILNPAIKASIASPTKGWNVNASYLVDFVSAASPDIVSTASPHGADTRHAVNVSGGYKPGTFGAQAGGAFSTESDYISRSFDVAVLADLDEKRITPRIGYAYTNDTVGRGGTPYDVFSHLVTAHEVNLSTSFILSPRTLVVAGVNGAFERGDPSKPYRLIPMFAAGVEVPRGATVDEVNAKRLSVRPYEQLPLDRDRYSIAARLNHRFAHATLRIDERLYDDSWHILSTSTDVRLLFDLSERVTAGPHARFHIQNGASFHQRVYHADTSPVLVVPTFRTTDRELSPLMSMTGGLAAWWKITDPKKKGPGFLIYASADILHSVYFDSIYATERNAGYGTLGVEAEFE